MWIHVLAGAFLAFAVILPAQAQRGPDSILIQGEIDRESLASFHEALRRVPRARIVLDSPGGEVLPALEIGRIIRQRRLTTLIPERAQCASACGLIWLAGAPRELGPQAVVGFHAAASISPSGRRSVSAPANAIIGGYLRDLGFNDEAIFEMTRAPPRGMNWFNTPRLNALGVAHGAASAPAPREAAPPPRVASPTARGLEGLWEGEYRCGRDARTARMMIWTEAGSAGASFEFGPTHASPHLEHGMVQMRGTPLPDGRMRFQPQHPPAANEGPPGLFAWLDGGVLKAEVINRRCEPVSLRKARS